jgi:hypothetical protein
MHLEPGPPAPSAVHPPLASTRRRDPSPPAVTLARDPSQPEKPIPSGRSPCSCDPAGVAQGRRFFQELWGRRHAGHPGKGLQGGRGRVPPRVAPDLSSPPHPRRRNKPPSPQIHAPYLVTEAADHQQVRAGRAIAAHGLLAAGAGQRVRHVTQGLGPRGRQGLGGPSRHGAHGSGRAAAAASSRCPGSPSAPGRGPALSPRSVRGPAPAGREPSPPPPPPPPRPVRSSSCLRSWAFPGAARPSSAPKPAAVNQHLGPSAQPAPPRRPPRAAPPPPCLSLGRGGRSEGGAAGRGGEGRGEERRRGESSAPARPRGGKCALCAQPSPAGASPRRWEAGPAEAMRSPQPSV